MYNNFSILTDATILNGVISTYISQGLQIFPGSYGIIFPFVPFSNISITTVFSNDTLGNLAQSNYPIVIKDLYDLKATFLLNST